MITTSDEKKDYVIDLAMLKDLDIMVKCVMNVTTPTIVIGGKLGLHVEKCIKDVSGFYIVVNDNEAIEADEASGNTTEGLHRYIVHMKSIDYMKNLGKSDQEIEAYYINNTIRLGILIGRLLSGKDPELIRR